MVFSIRIYASRDFIPYTIYLIPYTTYLIPLFITRIRPHVN